VAHGHDVKLAFAQTHPQALLSPPNVLELTRIICTDKDEIPDYTGSGAEPVSTGGLITNTFTVSGSQNRHYYREVVVYAERISLRRQLGLATSSTSDHSMRDIHLDITVQQLSGRVLINPPALSWPSSLIQYPSYISSTSFIMQPNQQAPVEIPVQNISESEWRVEADVPVVQAQRTVYLNDFFTIESTEDSNVSFGATVYFSDGPPFALSEELEIPFALSEELEIRIKSQEMSYREILRQIVPGYDEANR
jgi:hypothetical protein